MKRVAMPSAKRDAVRHMLLAGMRPRDVALGLELRSPQRAVIQLRKRAEARP